jgi:hypothetical protein
LKKYNLAAGLVNSTKCNKTGLEFFSEETAVLSGNIRSLDFLSTFLSSKK